LGVINGDLDLLGVAQLLQTLSASGSRGVLSISRQEERKSLDFGPDGIRLVGGVRRTNPLGEILVRSGKLDPVELEALLGEQRKTGRRFGELIVESGIVTQESIDYALREQVAEEIYDLFTWSGASFVFDTDRRKLDEIPPGPLSTVALDLNVMSLMIEAARRVDELQQIQAVIPDHRLVPQQVELPARLDDPSLDRSAVEEVLPLVDGERSIGHIIEASFYPAFTVLRTLYGLSRQGVIKIRDKGDAQGPVTIIHRPLRSADGVVQQECSVLIVSGLDTFRAALAFCMRTARCRPIEARNLDEARDLISRQPPEVIVVDTALETEDGLELCRGIRAETRIPMILLSNNGTRKAIVNALQTGAEYVLVKPFKEDVLMQRIAQVLSGERAAEAVAPPPPKGDHFLFG
jgi:CheY-like chemotaxis protein